MTATFTLMRRNSNGLETIGPTATLMSLDDVAAKHKEMTARYPHQEFVILGICSAAQERKAPKLKIVAPIIPEAKPKKKTELRVVSTEKRAERK